MYEILNKDNDENALVSQSFCHCQKNNPILTQQNDFTLNEGTHIVNMRPVSLTVFHSQLKLDGNLVFLSSKP